MANINGSFGLRPLSKLGGGSNSTGLTGYTPYEIANGNTDKIYHGPWQAVTTSCSCSTRTCLMLRAQLVQCCELSRWTEHINYHATASCVSRRPVQAQSSSCESRKKL